MADQKKEEKRFFQIKDLYHYEDASVAKEGAGGNSPYDSRFPNQNQSRSCWQNYIDFHRCQKIKGEDFEPCEYFKKQYTILCPEKWVDGWEERRESESLQGKL